MQQQDNKTLQMQESSLNLEDAVKMLAKFKMFLNKKNLLQQFKKQHSKQKQLITNISCLVEKPVQKKKPKKKKKPQRQQQQQNEQNQLSEQEQIVLPQLRDKRWISYVKSIQQFLKNEYYLFQNLYYKLKSATYTLFQSNFKLDVLNTRSNKRQEIIVTKNKRIFWVCTTKIKLSCAENRYFVEFPSKQIVYIQNPVFLQAIKKYWDKATFYAVVPMTIEKKPCAEIIMIEFDY